MLALRCGGYQIQNGLVAVRLDHMEPRKPYERRVLTHGLPLMCTITARGLSRSEGNYSYKSTCWTHCVVNLSN